jgi:cystathionine beta-lyase/cystathionine gamma-synthase
LFDSFNKLVYKFNEHFYNPDAPERGIAMKKGFCTKNLHAGKPRNIRDHTIPIHMSASYEARNEKELIRALAGYAPLYLRYSGNPTFSYVEKKICTLEHAAEAVLRSDGMNAVSMAIHGALWGKQPHGIVIGPVYGGTYDLLAILQRDHGYDFTFLSATSDNLAEQLFEAVDIRTAFVFGEITTNPTIRVWNIKAVAQAIKVKWEYLKSKKSAPAMDERTMKDFSKPMLIVDSSFASPYNIRPLTFGADVVVHSATKYLGGHGAFLAGIIAISKKTIQETPHYWKRAREWGFMNGGTPGPIEAWLLGQFMEDLHLRVPRQNENALRLAAFLEGHPAVITVFYPGLKNNPQHELAKKLLMTPYGEQGYGGMLSFRIKGGLESAKRFLFTATRSTILKHKPSLGYTKTIIESPWLMSQKSMSKAHKELFDITEDLIRVSVGTEDIEDIINAFKYALEKK